MTRYSLRVLAVLAVVLTPTVGRADPPKEPGNREDRVKTTTTVLGVKSVEGVVAKIDADGLTVVEVRKFGQEPIEHHLLPTDHLRAGKVPRSVSPRDAYRWEDVKVGDAVELSVAQDHIDKQRYCMRICIVRRPKGRLPESQMNDPDFPGLRLMNDLDNGVDVSDEEIMKVCPPRKEVRDTRGNLLQAASPGGLNKEWQAKLDAIRAKKDKDLKATPPDKK
jgi:hypothetical protein